MEPLKYYGILFLSFLSAFMSFNIFYMIMLNFCTALIKNFWGMQYNWMNTFAAKVLSNNEGMDIDFLVNWWFIAFCLFGVFAAVKGNDYYGYRSACFTFYAMT